MTTAMTNEQIERIKLAHEYAKKMHEGQTRRGGEPYIIHPEAVAKELASRGYGANYVIAALFHDLLEDTSATEAEILRLGGEDVLTAVKLLTKPRDLNMASYVAAIKQNPIAFAVKGFDRLNNVQTAVTTDEQFKKRYLIDTERWYLDFLPEIKIAAENLKNSISN